MNEEQLRWAHSYDAYELIASDTDTLRRIVDIPRAEYLRSGRVPGWAGVHLLRTWLFHLQRVDHWNDGRTAGDDEWQAVIAALNERGETVPGWSPQHDVGGPGDVMPTGHGLSEAVTTLSRFLSDTPLTTRITQLEHLLAGRSRSEIVDGPDVHLFAPEILDAALAIRQEFGRQDDIIHAATILAMLPHLLEPGEIISVRPSLAAGNDANLQRFDLETTHRVAEFKVSFWKKADAGRKRSAFADFAKLVLEDGPRRKQLFGVGDAPARFLRTTKSFTGWGLGKASVSLREEFGSRYPLDMPIRDFTAGPGAEVEIQDLTTYLPQLKVPMKR